MYVTRALVAGDIDTASCLGLPSTSQCGGREESIFCDRKEVRWLCDDGCNMRREGDVWMRSG